MFLFAENRFIASALTSSTAWGFPFAKPFEE